VRYADDFPTVGGDQEMTRSTGLAAGAREILQELYDRTKQDA